jgi:phage terminase Nu1 subunit (DNA packaging protein)
MVEIIRDDLTAPLADIAGLLGVSRQGFSDAAKREGFPRAKRNGHFRVRETIKLYVAAVSRVAAGRASATTSEKARLLKAQADIATAKAAREAGKLLDAGAVASEWVSVFKRVRAGVLSAASRVAARLRHLSKFDIAEIDAELRAVLSELAADDQSSH